MDRADLNFVNCYEDTGRSAAYSTLEFSNTYYLAYRDVPAIVSEQVTGTKALDFGCGTGRSTRFLRKLGFDVIGVDVSENMLSIARATDPSGDYRLLPGDDFRELDGDAFDLVLSAFTFDNIPAAMKARIFRDLGSLLAPNGIIVSVVSSPEMYLHEWASFSTKDFPENARAGNGDIVRNIITDHEDRRPVKDILCTDASYRAVYAEAGLQVIRTVQPLAKGDEPYAWVNETKIAPWVIYVLKRLV
ncbi:MAG: class I SAM-dependent DNA methyltransferase [Candidatus Sulfotelmatobacter sp.]